jgi:hypothetical protein
VTASLEAAKRVGQQIGDAVAAQEAVEQILRETPARGNRALPSGGSSSAAGPDDHTPIEGVPAARG